MSPAKSAIKKPIINPFEQVGEFIQDTGKKAGEELVNIINPFPEMWGSPTPKPESIPGGPNFSPVDFDKLNKQYANQDNPDIDKIRQQLAGMQGGDNQQPQLTDEQLDQKRHNEFKREQDEFYAKLDKEKADKERQEAYEKEQQILAEEEANAQPDATPQGKVRKNILGGGHKKANMELPPEVRSERRGGAGKH